MKWSSSGIASRAAALVALLVGLNVIFLSLLSVSQAVSSKAIVRHLRTDAVAARISTINYPTTRRRHMVDAFTECVALGMDTYPGGGSFLHRAIAADQRGSCGYLVPGLFDRRPNTDVTYDLAPGPYYRFWHGYQVLTRPLLAVGGVRALRDAGDVLLVAALLAFGLALARAAGVVPALAVLVPLVLLTDFADLPRSFPHALDVAAALALAAAVLQIVKRRAEWWAVAAAALAAGAVYNFLDFLLNPSLAVTLVAFAVVVSARTATRDLFALEQGGIALCGWVFGYLGTFVCKWIFAGFVFGPSAVLANIKDQVEYRVGGAVTPVGAPRANFDLSFGAATLRNLHEYRTSTLLGLAAGAAVLLVFAVYERRGSTIRDFLVLAAPAAIPFVWYEFAREHSARHYWFTYRSLAVSFGIVLASAVIAARESRS